MAIDRGSVVGPIPEPIEGIDKYAALLEKIRAMIEEMIDEAFADRENPAEYYELIKEYVTQSMLTNVLGNTYQAFMLAGKMFVVQSAGSGNGIYDCYEQGLLNAEWHDTDGDSKFANKNTQSVEVLNLGEYNPHSTYVAALVAGDLLMSWQLIDSAGTIRWVGAPFNQDNAYRPRIAYCKTDAGAGSTIVCYLDTDGTGTEITVNCNISGGSNLNTSLRRLEDGNRMIVAKIGANWYCKEGFQGSEDCICTSP